MSPFVFRQARRQLHVDRRVQIATLVGFPDGRHPVTAEPEHAVVGRELRNLQPQRRPGQGRHVHFAAQNRGGHRNRHAGMEILPAALEPRMRANPHRQEQIARRAARRARGAFAGGPHARAILDAGGADQLIGRGDMLLSTGADMIRLQCAFVDTPEVEKITEFIGNQRGYPDAFLLPEYVGESDASGGSDLDSSDRQS